MKTNAEMTTPVQIATGIIDKLQEENRVCLETLHKAQDTIKHNERQLAEKNRLIKVLEERLRTGTDGILEMTNRQKELTIKHLELQIQKLLRENEELELQLESIKSEICAKCETKLLLRENSENRGFAKSYKNPSGKATGVLFEKKTSNISCPDRLQSYQRIVDHKDKRINHLSKEVKRLTNIEKELTQKIYRLTKLLPMARLPPEAVTDCLLQEIQFLESQTHCDDKQKLDKDLFKLKGKPFVSERNLVNKCNIYNSMDRLKKASASNIKKSEASIPRHEITDDVDMSKAENTVLCKKLKKLCNDVAELKRLFVYESDRLSHGLRNTTQEYNQFKIQLEEIINNLNDVVQSILNNNYFHAQCETVSSTAASESDDKYVISCLQERLRESLAMVTEYENENKILKERMNILDEHLPEQDKVSCKQQRDKMFRSPINTSHTRNGNDVKKLKEDIKLKEKQLEAAESHLDTCQKYINDLQKTYKNATFDNLRMPSSSSAVRSDKTPNIYEQQNKALQTKLDVSEKQIQTCQGVIEGLQDAIRSLEEENARIETELHKVKSQKLLEVNDSNRTKLGTGEQISNLKKSNQELQNKVKTLEDVVSKLKSDIKTYENKNLTLEIAEKEKGLLKAQIEASEKHISSLQRSVETLQDKLHVAENKNENLEANIKNINHEKNLTETYEHDVMALKNELILKESENRELKESLNTLENKALEMNHFRKSLHQEIEKLCKALMEKDDSEDGSKRKAIYKAAVFHSAQALLRLDDDFNLKPEDSEGNSALDEIKHQIEVYLTEVSRIHELVTIKEHERDELLKEYLDLNDGDVLQPTSSLHHKTNIQGEPSDANLQSSNLHDLHFLESIVLSSSKNTKSVKFDTQDTSEIKLLQEELTATKSVTTYLLSSCRRLEDLLELERTERAKCEKELEIHLETVKDLKIQLNIKATMTKRLNSIIEMMRSKECNHEINVEQLKSEIKGLVEENKKIFDRVSKTQLELCKCKEENSRIQNDLDALKRDLMNERYENSKVNRELKLLRLQISHSQSSLYDT